MDIHLCGACKGFVEQGALRCKHCNAAFRGPKAEPQVEIDPSVKVEGASFSISVKIRDVLLDGEGP
jgi:hypothetical protein